MAYEEERFARERLDGVVDLVLRRPTTCDESKNGNRLENCSDSSRIVGCFTFIRALYCIVNAAAATLTSPGLSTARSELNPSSGAAIISSIRTVNHNRTVWSAQMLRLLSSTNAWHCDTKRSAEPGKARIVVQPLSVSPKWVYSGDRITVWMRETSRKPISTNL